MVSGILSVNQKTINAFVIDLEDLSWEGALG
jgi:hypothetical protein